MSLFDHFENEIPVQQVATPSLTAAPSLADMEPKGQMFSLDKVQFTFPGEIVTMAVANNMLAVAVLCATQKMLQILRIDLGKPDVVQGRVRIDIDVRFQGRLNDRISRMFQSPYGHFLLISCESGDNYLLHSQSSRPRLLGKIKVSTVYTGPGYCGRLVPRIY